MSEAAPAEQPPGEPGPGALLKSARSRRGLTLADVAQRLKYGERQIEALEADAFSRLPGTTIVRGMVRGYCKLLGIDAAPVLESLERRRVPLAAPVHPAAMEIPFPDANRRSTRLLMGLSGLVALAVAAIAGEWRFGDLFPLASDPAPSQQVAAPSAPVAAPAPAQSQSSPGAAPAPEVPIPEVPIASANRPAALPETATPAGADGQKRILLEFQSEAWVEIRDRQGKKLISQMNPGGTQKLVEGEPPFEIVIGNAPNVRLRYNDEPVDLRPHFKVDVARLTLE